jgi:hypothetical protein
LRSLEAAVIHFTVFMPQILVGQSPSTYLYFVLYQILGLTLIFIGIHASIKKKHFVQLIAA